MKISILGYSGSGKSTLAKAVGELYGLPVLHLDYVHFLPNWEERTREEMSAIVQQFLDGNDAWVIDGTYSHNCFERRIQESDLVIFLDFNRVACFFRAWKRYRENKGRTRMEIWRKDVSNGLTGSLSAGFCGTEERVKDGRFFKKWQTGTHLKRLSSKINGV